MALGALGVLMIRLMTLAGAPEAITRSQFVGVAQTYMTFDLIHLGTAHKPRGHTLYMLLRS